MKRIFVFCSVLMVLCFASLALAQSPSPTPAVTPVAPVYRKGRPITLLHAPFTQMVAYSESGGAALSFQLPNVAGFTTQLDYAWLTYAPPIATVSTTLTISGIRGQAIVLDVVENSSIGSFLEINSEQLPASSPATNITFALDGVGSGASCNINVKYSFED